MKRMELHITNFLSSIAEFMKLPHLDLPTLHFLSRVSDYGLAQEFDDILFQYFFRSSLQSLKRKLTKAVQRIREAVTLQLSLSEAMCLKWTLEMWNEAQAGTLAVDVLRKYFSLDENKKAA